MAAKAKKTKATTPKRKRPGPAQPAPKEAAPPPRKKSAPRHVGRTIAILSRKRSLHSTSGLVRAARERGHRAIVLDTLRCNLLLEKNLPRMLFRGVEVRGIDVVIPRIGASITSYGLAVVNHFDMMGVPVLNASGPIARSRDKLRCLQLLAQSGIDVPRTVMARDRHNISQLIEEVGGLPAIIKLIRGTQGVGVMIAQSLAEVQSILDTFSALDQDIVLQEFVKESKGRDIRALVLGDRVLGAMRRTARRGEFRSNIHRGGSGKPVKLDPLWAAEAVKAAQVIGLELAGVDMLETKDGPKIMEINSSPGWEGLEQATGIDVAGAIIEHAVAFAAQQRSSEQRRSMLF
ncbi:MAG: RimK family alpha-L-glutamate ligase [Myxococcaceae bacterium]|nr:RimK family alpha-L-glutamate ligase [Myxococcaceae bacterium]